MAPQFKTNIDKLEGVQLRPPEWEEEEKLCLGGGRKAMLGRRS